MPALRRALKDEILDSREQEAIDEHLREAVLLLIGKETRLHHNGASDDVYEWFQALSSYAVLFPNIASIWNHWWMFPNEGAAIAAIEWLSCLMYEEDANPVFNAWTRTGGGGARKMNSSFMAQVRPVT